MLGHLMYIVRKYSEENENPTDNKVEEITTAAEKYFFWDENTLGKLGQIGKDNSYQKWLYITDTQNNISGTLSTCRSKITILHNLWESEDGQKALFKFIINADDSDKIKYPFVVQRKAQIYDLFNIRDDKKLLFLLDRPGLIRLRISWSQVDYMYPGVAMRRIIQGYEGLRYVGEIRKRLTKNIKSKNMNNIQRIINVDNPKRVYSGVPKWDFNMLIEPLSDVEKTLIKQKQKITQDGNITYDNYKFKPGAYYNRSLIMNQSPSDIQNHQEEKCRVSGISGSCAIIADLCVLLQVNWKPIYFGLLIDYVPIHHSIREVLQTLNQMGFITDNEYDKPALTLAKHAYEIQNMNEENIKFDYTPYTNDITRGYKLKLSVGGSFSSNDVPSNGKTKLRCRRTTYSNRLMRKHRIKHRRTLKQK